MMRSALSVVTGSNRGTGSCGGGEREEEEVRMFLLL